MVLAHWLYIIGSLLTTVTLHCRDWKCYPNGRYSDGTVHVIPDKDACISFPDEHEAILGHEAAGFFTYLVIVPGTVSNACHV